MKSLIPLLLIFTSLITFAQTNIGGTYSTNQTLTAAGSPYLVTSSITVNNGITLTIESGVEIRFNDNLELQVNGTLSANGVTFTSANSSPTAGVWQGIDISSTSSQTFTNCQVLYAVNGLEIIAADVNLSGSSFTSISGHAIYSDHSVFDLRNTITAANITVAGAGVRGIYINRGNLNLSNSNFSNINFNAVYFSDNMTTGETAAASSSVSNTTISDATASGLVFNGGTVAVSDITFSNSRFPFEFINEAEVNYLGTNIYTNNDFDAIWMNYASINTNLTLRDAGIPYYISRTMTVENSVEMVIESGAILKFTPGAILSIEGKLNADAAVDEDIILTSWYDDNVSGDTNGDSNNTSASSNGQWYGVHFQDNSDDASSISGATLKWVRYYGAIRTNSASPTIDNNFITNCYYGGEFLGASSPTFSNNEIAASERTPIAMTLDANPIFSNNSFSSSDNEYDAIGLLGSVLTRDNTLPQRNFTDIDNVTYVLLGSVDIPVGTSLTIDPGVVIKSESGHNVEVQGELIADGNIADGPIVFTSINDDNYGNPLDTRNDGTERIPAIGNFGGIYFGENAESTSLLDSVLIKFANYTDRYQSQARPTSGTVSFSYSAAVAINQSEPTISNSEISDSNYGIDMRGLSSPVLTSNVIKNTDFAPFRQAIQSTPVYTSNTFTSVGWKGVAILPELINYSATLSKQSVAGYDNILYIITDLDINETAEITIEDGIYIKMDISDYIEVFGGLNIAGTVESPVTITTLADDNTGPFTDPLDNDTQGNGNATDPTTRKWASIIFYEMSDDTFSKISHTKLLYGGNDRAPILWRNAAASVDNVEISFSQNYGLYFEGASTPTVNNVSINTSRADPLAMSYFADPTFSNITFNANGSNGIYLFDTQLNADATLAKRDIAGINNIGYVMNNLTIDNGATLTINPGVVLKLSSSRGVHVKEGSIQAIGTESENIIFTSLKDDSRGGDTNIDGNGSVPAIGDWFGVAFDASSVASNLAYTEFRYGGNAGYWFFGSEYEGTIVSRNNALSMSNCVVQLSNSSAFGIYGTSTASLTNNRLENVSRFPIHMSMFANPSFTGNTMENVAWFALGIVDESFNQSGTFPFRSFAGVDSVTYYPTARSGAAMTINSGTKITIPAGMHFKSQSERIFEVNGELHIAGTAEDPVVFTGFYDDEYGRPRDTENNGLPTSIPVHGKVIEFNNISDDASLVEHTIIRYKDRAAELESASPTFDNNLFEFLNWGVVSTGISEPTYTNNNFKDLSFTPFTTSMVAYPATTSGNTMEGTTWRAIHINNETLTQDTTLYKRSFASIDNIPYFFNNYTVGLGVKLAVDPGVILKFGDFSRSNGSSSGARLTVQGALEADGDATTDGTIIFTSMRDDFYGGDTNGDSTYTSTIYYEWDGIHFTNESSDSESIINNAVIRGSTWASGVNLNSASPTISNTLFWQNGISNSYGGLLITGASNPTLANNDFIDNSYLSGTTVQGFGISNTGTFTIDATNSWWGDNSGPYHATLNIEGKGDQILGNVTFDPWAMDNSLNPITGDVSLNGTVSAYDAALTLQDVAAVINFEARQDRAGDVSGDGTVSAMDASYILQFAAGKIQSFPAEAENKRTQERFVSTHSEAILTIGDAQISMPQEEVSIPLSVSNIRSLHALSMRLPLGEDLDFVDFAFDDNLPFSPTLHLNHETNELNLAFGLIDGLKEDFELGTLRLKLNKDKVHFSSFELLPSKLYGNETDVLSLAKTGMLSFSGSVLSANNQVQMSVYPNPAVDRIMLLLPDFVGQQVEVQIIDTSGKNVLSVKEKLKVERMELRDLRVKPGIYVIKIVGETREYMQQLIIGQ
ncbi:MAG: right-handed parallel beta-helix repeat-containing protein [Cyclobacteriaceae bacterium]